MPTIKQALLTSLFLLCIISVSISRAEETNTTLTGTISGTGEIQTKEKKEAPPIFGSPEFFLTLKKQVRVGLFYDDASLFRFVSKKTPLNSRNYRPENLVSIAGEHIDEAGRIGYIRADAKESLLALAEAFETEFGTPLVVISGYRSAQYQQRLWDMGKCSDSLCAPPGYSEHQLGLAVDLFDASNNKDFESNKRYKMYVNWMKKNGHFYGWTQSYQKGQSIDAYEIEPWHWRYLGKEMATRLKRLGWTFTEYVRFQEAIQRR